MRWYVRMPRFLSVLLALFLVALVVSGVHIISMLTVDRNIVYSEVEFRSDRVPVALSGYTLAFITDTHAMTKAELLSVAEELNRRAPDLLLLGGDFPSSEGAPGRAMEALSHAQPTDGIYGVEGNHDDYVTLFAAMEAHGIKPLSNSGAQIREGLYLAGVEDLWNRRPNIAAATKGAQQDDFVLLLAHNADVTMQQDTTGADLVLSGHTHGGQATFFGLWAPALTLRTTITDYGQRFMAGWSTSHDGVPVYVSRGTGYLQSVPRVFSRPEVVLLRLMATEKDGIINAPDYTP